MFCILIDSTENQTNAAHLSTPQVDETFLNENLVRFYNSMKNILNNPHELIQFYNEFQSYFTYFVTHHHFTNEKLSELMLKYGIDINPIINHSGINELISIQLNKMIPNFIEKLDHNVDNRFKNLLESKSISNTNNSIENNSNNTTAQNFSIIGIDNINGNSNAQKSIENFPQKKNTCISETITDDDYDDQLSNSNENFQQKENTHIVEIIADKQDKLYNSIENCQNIINNSAPLVMEINNVQNSIENSEQKDLNESMKIMDMIDIDKTSNSQLLKYCMDCIFFIGYDESKSNETVIKTCRFENLLYNNGQFTTINDSSEVDRFLWIVPSSNIDISPNDSKYILTQIYETFNKMIINEKLSFFNHLELESNEIIWRKPTQYGELCDSCKATIFNYHLLCVNCGYMMCIDCSMIYKSNEMECIHKGEHKMRAVQIIINDPYSILQQLKSNCEEYIDTDITATKNDNNNYFNNEYWLHDNSLLVINKDELDDHMDLFSFQWQRNQPIIINNNENKLIENIWTPKSFEMESISDSQVKIHLNNTITKTTFKTFWRGFGNHNKRQSGIRNLYDCPYNANFSEIFPMRYQNINEILPLNNYTCKNGKFNLSNRLPNNFNQPDLGPKLNSGYGFNPNFNQGTINLHLNICDSINIMVHVNVPTDFDNNNESKYIELVYNEFKIDEFQKKKT